MQVITCNLGHQRQTRVTRLAFAPIKVASERVEQGVDGALAHDAQITAMERVECLINGHGQAAVLAQGGGKAQLAVGWYVLEQRV